jgi:hypothetical protein
MLEPIDTRTERQEDAREVAQAYPWLTRAMKVYGRRRILATMAAWGRDGDAVDVEGWRRYIAQREGGQRHPTPRVLMDSPWWVVDGIAFELGRSLRAA